jgi:hypothetical protein
VYEPHKAEAAAIIGESSFQFGAGARMHYQPCLDAAFAKTREIVERQYCFSAELIRSVFGHNANAHDR